eukprot:6491966-Amphidinium_carterae.1
MLVSHLWLVAHEPPRVSFFASNENSVIERRRHKAWRARCAGRGEVPVGRGALDETFDLAFDTERITAAGKPQAGVFLDCSKCYERIPLQKLEAFALESGYPLYALYAALDMYAGRRRVLLQGAVSEPVTAIHGMPPGCGHAIDLLHAFLLKTLQSAGRHVSVRKYVDDMVLVAQGPCFARHLCHGYRQVHKSLTKANMIQKVNLKKTVVICNGANAKRLLMKVWRAGRLPPPWVTTRDLGVDTQWAAWRCPVQRKRVITFKQSMNRVRSLGLPATSKARIAKSLYSVGLYGAEVGGMSASHMNDVRISARKALGKGANLQRSSPLELMAYGGPAGDPQ